VNKKETEGGFLVDQFNSIEKLIPKREAKNEKVSQADVAWHLDHLLKTINQLTNELENSNPAKFTSSFSMQKAFVFTMGRIPRGVAKTPENLRPPDVILTDNLYAQLANAREKVAKISNLNENAFFGHPVFKNINRDQTIRFLEIHTKHHLKIIKDILRE